MKDENRALSWKQISEILYNEKSKGWKYKPKFKIGEIVVVKQTASDINLSEYDYDKMTEEWGKLLAGFDRERKKYCGCQGVVVSVSCDNSRLFHKYGCGFDYHVAFGGHKGGKTPQYLTMVEAWLKKNEGGLMSLPGHWIGKRLDEEDKLHRSKIPWLNL